MWQAYQLPKATRGRLVGQLEHYTKANSGGGITTMTSSAVGMISILDTTQIGNHHGYNLEKTSLQKMVNLEL